MKVESEQSRKCFLRLYVVSEHARKWLLPLLGISEVWSLARCLASAENFEPKFRFEGSSAGAGGGRIGRRASGTLSGTEGLRHRRIGGAADERRGVGWRPLATFLPVVLMILPFYVELPLRVVLRLWLGKRHLPKLQR